MAISNRSLENVLDIIERHHKKVGERRKKWRGPLVAKDAKGRPDPNCYVGLVLNNPKLAETAHQRLWRVLFSGPGWREVKASQSPGLTRALDLKEDESILIFNAWSNNFFGIEQTISRIALYFHGGANKGEEYRQAPCLIGPVGGAKSSILEKMASLLEGEPLYIPEGCTHLCDPLWFLPRSERENLSKELGVEIDPDMDICPICRWHLVNDLKERYEDVVIIEESFSKRKRGVLGRGIAQVTPVELENADISALIGSIAVSEIDEYLQGDPRAIELTGAYSQGNRGFVENVEGFEYARELLTPIITVTQEKRVGAPGRQPMLWVDLVTIIHSNQEPYEQFMSDPRNKKFKDRIFPIYVPYNLRWEEEIKIYEKLIKRSTFKDYHRAPHTLETVSLFTILTREKCIDESKERVCDPITRAKVLNGEEVKIGARIIRVSDLKKDLRKRGIPPQSEGMDGISYREIAKVLDSAFSYNAMRNIRCINPMLVLRFLLERLEESQLISQDSSEFKRYSEFVELVFKEHYIPKLRDDITKAFFRIKEEEAEGLFHKYLDHAELYINWKRTLQGPRPSEDFLKEIERHIARRDYAAIETFRQALVEYARECKESGKPLHYWHYEPMKGVIEKILSKWLEDLLRIPTEDRLRDSHQKENYKRVIEKLIESHGYCEVCAPYLCDWYVDNVSNVF